MEVELPCVEIRSWFRIWIKNKHQKYSNNVCKKKHQRGGEGKDQRVRIRTGDLLDNNNILLLVVLAV